MTTRTLGLIMNGVSRLADKAGLLRDPARAASRMKAVLAVRGLA